MRRTDRTPGSVSPVYGPPPALTCQSRMRPTKGEIRNAPASAQAIACAQREQQRQVAVDALLLQDLGGADALPGGGDLDQDALAGDAARRVGGDDGARLVDRRRRVEGEVGVHLGRDAARHDAGELRPEGDGEPVADRRRDAPRERRPGLGPSARPPRGSARKPAFRRPSAARSGWSCNPAGFRRRTASMSPVSATTTVMARSWSSFEGMVRSRSGVFRHVGRSDAPVKAHSVPPPHSTSAGAGGLSCVVRAWRSLAVANGRGAAL